MAEPRTLLDEVLEAWEYTRAGVVAEVENMPADRLDFRPAPESRSAAELVLHIVTAGRMAAGELTRPDGDFRRQSFDAHLREHAADVPEGGSKAELVALLVRTGEEDRSRVRDAGEIALLQRIRRFDGRTGTRLAWLNHAIDHESYHRGQLALYARLMGVVPALTQRIQGTA